MKTRSLVHPLPLSGWLCAALLGQGCLSATPAPSPQARVQGTSDHALAGCDGSADEPEAPPAEAEGPSVYTEAPLPDDTEAPLPDDTEALLPDDTEAPLPDDTEAPLPGDAAAPLPDDAAAPTDEAASDEPSAPTSTLTALSDEFDDPASLATWSRVWQTEQWPVDQLESLTVEEGAMVLVPRASTWYGDWRGVLLYKEVTGDFIVDARVTVTNRAGTGAPSATYSLAGLMLRAPRAITPATWVPGGENHLFLSVGAAENAGELRAETKTTLDSVSTLRTTPFVGDAQLRIARIGADVIQMIRPVGGTWTVHERYYRPDLPATLQVGAIAYTDWPTASSFSPLAHNMTAITGGNPDLRGRFDWVRFGPAAVPEWLAGVSLQSAAVSDATLLELLSAPLGDEASAPVDDPSPSAAPEPSPSEVEALSDEFDDATTLEDWHRVQEVEQWGADPAEVWDIDGAEPGAMTVIPRSSCWYQDYVGFLAFKEVTGDFIAETRLTVTNRAGDAAPTSLYSLGGLMLRAARDVSPATWAPGGEDYVFAAIGTAGTPGQYVVEVKSTRDSVSQLETTPGGSEARVRVARLGAHIAILAALPGQPFAIVRRYVREDLPLTLQAGPAAYTDWVTVSGYTPYEHNQTEIEGGSPDVAAHYDYLRFESAPDLGGADPGALTDAQLLALLAP